MECLENILKHAARLSSDENHILPDISVTRDDNHVIIAAGNSIDKHKLEELAARLCRVNQLDEPSLKSLYEHKINRDIVPGENGAGLGFITMRLKSGNLIDYSFTDIGNGLAYFKLRIAINKYTMRKLIIEQTSVTPRVYLDPDKNFFVISGESRPADVSAFFSEILIWFNDYSLYLVGSKENNKPVVFDLDFEYFNSSSAKYLLDFCKQIATARTKGLDMSVRWHYEGDDIDMLQAGREMSRIVKVPFEQWLRA